MSLRFAPLVRVSTEQQEKQGESLRTQKEQIKEAVKALGGKIPKRCWAYSGQEHATPNHERHLLDQLLKDASKGLFDAVMVVDASRWSRDNEKSKKGLRTLKDNGVRFFTGTFEHDLTNPSHTLFLGMAAEIGEYQANIQALKSIQNRIARARRGLPASGNLPFGRTFDKGTETWGLDNAKVKDIQYAAKRYLAGESMADIAQVVGVKDWTLWKVLRKRSGEIWEQRFRSKKLNIDETVPTPVPPLLGEETIKAIAARAEANKTYAHGQYKHYYLLSRMVFCSECGYAMSGQTNHGDRRYYRHAHAKRERLCDNRVWVRANDLEEAVMTHLFHTLGDPEAIEEAMKRAIPNPQAIDKLHDDKRHLKDKLKRVREGRERLVSAVAEGLLSNEDILNKRSDLDEQEEDLRDRLAAIEIKIESMPRLNTKRMKLAARTLAEVRQRQARSYRHFQKMTEKQKRALAEFVFAGKDAEGKRLGVYVTKNEKGEVVYTINGRLPEVIQGRLPMAEGLQNFLLDKPDPDEDMGFDSGVTKFAWR